MSKEREVVGYFRIDLKLPSLNETLGANKTNRYMGAKLKKDTQKAIGAFILLARQKGTLDTVDVPVDVYIRWHEKDKRRDADNVESSTKFILDALVENGILHNDNRKWVEQVYPKIIDDTETFSEVWLVKAGD